MLSYLRIRGLALLDDVTLELAPGLNVLTGETGAGKSIIVDALTLLRGARARAELVRSGEANPIVDAQFELAGDAEAQVEEVLREHGLPSATGEIVIQRVVPRSGRGRCFVQGQLTTQAVLERISEHLIDVCSQHEHHSLTRVSRHLDLLDSFARLDGDLSAYAERYRAYREARAAFESLTARAADAGKRADYLRFQVEEIERASPAPGELEGLARKLELMRHAHRWVSLARDAEQELYEAEQSIIGRLANLADRCREGRDSSERLAHMTEQLDAARIACDEAVHEAQRLLGELDFDPVELDQAEERASLLIGLGRRHGVSPDELGGELAAMRAELEELSNVEERLAALRQESDRLERLCVEHAERLHQARRAAVERLGAALQAELSALHLPEARFGTEVELLPKEQLSAHGLSRVQFLFSANPGEPLAPLTRVASGGELSRVLLALKGVLSTGDSVATYVFDEVDAGVGGAVAEAIGRRLRRAAERHQVLCITHLPQIAAFAHAHLRVEKQSRAGRTTTRVAVLDGGERREELARMLGGSRVTESARQHAGQLIEEAERGSAAAKRARRGSGSTRARP